MARVVALGMVAEGGIGEPEETVGDPRSNRDHLREDPVAAVRRQGFLARLSAQLAGEVTSHAPLVHYPAGSVSAPVGDALWAGVVVFGVFRQYLPMSNGRQLTIRYARAGALVGSPDAETPHLRAEIEAVEPSGLLHLDMARILRTARSEPELSLALADELTSRLAQAYRILAVTAFATVRSRVARDLLERMGRENLRRPGAHLRVTQQALADATGSVREVVARALRDLRRQGLIDADQSGITVLKPDELIAEAGYGPELPGP